MTENEQRIAIAEACGWEFCPTSTDGIPEWHRPDGSVCNSGVIPDYLYDLNAMHEAEGTLWNESESVERYKEHLQGEYLQAVGYSGAGYWWMAGPGIRAKAFLLAIGKWKD